MQTERGLPERASGTERGLPERTSHTEPGGPFDRLRADLAQLASDSSAPDVPGPVTARVIGALRAAPPARRKHAVRVSAAIGTAAMVAAAGLGTVMLARSDSSSTSRSAQHLGTAPPPVTVPLSDDEILGLLDRSPDLGPLADTRRRSSCLSGLGYSADSVLGAQQVDVDGAPAVLLALPGDTPDTVLALAVRANCSAADTGLLADTSIRRPSR